MKSTLRRLATLLIVGTLVTPSHAANSFKISDDLDRSIKLGLSELYDLQFEKADKIFDGLKDQAAEHPMVAFGKASVHWWRLSVYVLETDSEESKAFIAAVNDCIQISKDKIDKGDPTGEGYLALGGAYGLLGRWQATNQEWMSAYFTGKKAIKFLRRALKENPEMKDAYMGLGIFDYYVATLPAVLRVLAFVGSGGDAQVGVQELTIASTESVYAQTPSKLFLAEIYSNPENKPEKALELLAGLRKEYPRSHFIHMLEVIAYYNHDRLDDLAASAKSFQEMMDNGTYDKHYEVQAHFAQAAVKFKARKWEEAIQEYDKGIATGTVKDPFFTWSNLYKGYALDALGRRKDAVAMYQVVLKQIRRWGSWDAAKKYSSKPWQPTDENMKKLLL